MLMGNCNPAVENNNLEVRPYVIWNAYLKDLLAFNLPSQIALT